MDIVGDTVSVVAAGDDNVDIAAAVDSVVAVDDTAVDDTAVDNTAAEKDILLDDGSVAASTLDAEVAVDDVDDGPLDTVAAAAADIADADSIGADDDA